MNKIKLNIISTNNPSVIYKTDVIPISFCDYDMICCVRKQNHTRYNSRLIKCRNYKNYNPKSSCDALSAIDWSPVYSSNCVNNSWAFMKNAILSTIDHLALKIDKKIKGKPCPWLTADLKRNMNIRDQLLRKSRRTKLHLDIYLYKRKRNHVNKLVKIAKRDYHKQLLDDSSKDPDKFWNTNKKVFINKSNNQTCATFKINNEITLD